MKKIFIFIMSCLFIVGLAPASSAIANSTATTGLDMKYRDIEDFMHSSGYTSFVMNDNSVYVVYDSDGYFYILEVLGIQDQNPYFCYAPNTTYKRYIIFADVYYSSSSVKFYKFYNPNNASKNNNYNCLNSDDTSGSSVTTSSSLSFCGIVKSWRVINNAANKHLVHSNIVYSDLNLYETAETYDFYRDVNTLLLETSKYNSYEFPVWCNDSGLNCLASSNESPSKIPYSYNDYWHIVRKTSSGKWLLTTIGNSVIADCPDDFKLYVGDNGNLNVYSIYGGDDTNGYLLDVRQYEYDTDGWKVRTYNSYDFRETSGIIDLGSGSGFDDTRKLAYNNVGIFVGTELNPTYPASTEYYEIVVPDVPEDPTPTSTPAGGGSGSGSSGGGTGGGTRPEGGSTVGGQAKPGGMLDFIITFFTLVWTKLFAVEVPVDGYNISFQAIVIFGAIAGVLIWLGKSSFGKKG